MGLSVGTGQKFLYSGDYSVDSIKVRDHKLLQLPITDQGPFIIHCTLGGEFKTKNRCHMAFNTYCSAYMCLYEQ